MESEGVGGVRGERGARCGVKEVRGAGYRMQRGECAGLEGCGMHGAARRVRGMRGERSV